ncbi:hypothetical protein GOP47_0019279 [Adiantum capillus-veneris]|uniref:Peroxidase n=1 Tax=Adiantum capillus-veneris TaxID=13818 RepID=A0A9D4ZAI1_ADICA|nr:hypothetical protein GOP47_0019279 [Adiantum capillus-veneris]
MAGRPVDALVISLLLLSLIIGLLRSVNAGRSLEGSSGPLQYNFYKSSCPSAESIVRQVVGNAVANEARMAGSLLRLHFHDCFVQGCDGSLLLKSIPGVLEGEQEALPNINSVRGFDVVDDIKAALEKECPGVVSCADILAMAARDSVVVSGGPSYRVLLGRRDSLTASRSLANQFLPGFNFNVSDLIANFANVGLSARDMVVLSGGHTIGKANCNTFAARLTPNVEDPTALEPAYRESLVPQCPAGSNAAFVNLDIASPTLFDNGYYSNLLRTRGLLHSDQVLYSTAGTTRNQVARYAKSQAAFFSDFTAAIIKMGNIAPLTGSTQGEVRTQCGFVNSS